MFESLCRVQSLYTKFSLEESESESESESELEFLEKFLNVFAMYFMSAGTVRNAISSCRVLFLITLIHIFLGNVLVSHNPSVYVPVATKLPIRTMCGLRSCVFIDLCSIA